jgi:hypothetical protein
MRGSVLGEDVHWETESHLQLVAGGTTTTADNISTIPASFRALRIDDIGERRTRAWTC